MAAANDTTSNILLYILAILLPPVSVYLKTGCGGHMILNLILLFLTWFPAIIHAIYVVYTRKDTSYSLSSRRREEKNLQHQTQPQQQSFPAQPAQPQAYQSQPRGQGQIQPTGVAAAPPYPYAEAPGEVKDEKHEYRAVQ